MNRKQVIIGVVALFIGSLIYLINRPPDQTYFVYSSGIDISLYNVLPRSFGPMGNSLPSFLHVFAFIFITAGILACSNRWYPVICMGWCSLDCAFEFGQKYSALPLKLIPKWFEGIPYLENTANYFRLGTFDVLDVFAIMLGSVAAYYILIFTTKGGEENA